jgi:N-acetyl-gamma-glutamyl-phosphate/LysW-gamma-L-alpha-aminoadipyl-6-phosphate reductase
MVKIGIIGASGYVGGELLRILLTHNKVEVELATSRQHAGEYVFKVHPNLKGITDLQFSADDPVTVSSKVDIIFISAPHGASCKIVSKLVETGTKIIDMGADFRLKDPAAYDKWYGWTHPTPDLLNKFVYGLPELHREELKTTKYVAVPGCMATSAIVSLAPLAKAGIIEKTTIVDAKIGSSGAGGKPSLSTHFSERFGVVRPYKPVAHRHTAEIEQELKYVSGKDTQIGMTAHAVNMVRGILTTSHVMKTDRTDLATIWKAYRNLYKDEPFVRFIMDKKGLYQYPDPKITIGSNFADVGFAIDPYVDRIVVFGAIDNLIKGAAGNAIQSMNVMMGFNEKDGLNFPALHPV